jgi:hypothetical protein
VKTVSKVKLDGAMRLLSPSASPAHTQPLHKRIAAVAIRVGLIAALIAVMGLLGYLFIEDRNESSGSSVQPASQGFD